MKREALRHGISLLFSLLLTLFLSGIILLATILLVGHDTSAVTSGITDDYVQAAYRDLMDDWYAFGEPGHIPEEVFDRVLSQEELAVDLRAYAGAVWVGDSYTVKTAHMEKQLLDAFTAFVQSENVEITEEVTESLTLLAGYCCDRYETYATVPLLPTVAGMALSFKGMALWGLGGAIVLGLLTGLLLRRLQHGTYYAWRYTSYAALGASLVVLPLPVYLLLARPHDRFSLRPDYVKALYIGLVDRALQALVLGGVVLLLVGILCMLLAWAARRRHPHHRKPGKIWVADETTAMPHDGFVAENPAKAEPENAHDTES